MNKVLALIKIQSFLRSYLVRQNPKLIALKRNRKCSISLKLVNYYEAIVTQCGHVFLKDALIDWYNYLGVNQCPNCRTLDSNFQNNFIGRHNFSQEQLTFLVEFYAFRIQFGEGYRSYLTALNIVLTQGLGRRSAQDVYRIVNQEELRQWNADFCDIFVDAWTRLHDQEHVRRFCCVIN